MQEETGSIAAESVEETSKSEKKAKNSKKKEVKIPTVAAIVEAENAAPAAETSSESAENAAPAAEASSEPAEASTEPAASESSLPEEDDADAEENAEVARLRASLNLDSETALVETVLFLESEPQPTENLAKITQLSEDVITECIGRLKEKYLSVDSGIELSQIIGGWILTPKKDCFNLVKERYGKKNEGRLSKAAIETLSIIAYSQPITRAEIESIRHVNVDNMMRILLDRNFIKEVGKKDVPGKPIMYGTTKEFLEFFHMQSIAELPQLDEKESERFELAR